MAKLAPDFDLCPFKVVIDDNEGAPWLFREIIAKGTKRPLVIKTVNKSLWSMSKRPFEINGRVIKKGLADYSIDGLEERIQIERKSHSDLYQTLGSRRDEFEAEMCRLSLCDYACVIVECGWGQVGIAPDNSDLHPSSVIGTILSWQQRYNKVHWIMSGTRAIAERLAFRTLERFWENNKQGSA